MSPNDNQSRLLKLPPEVRSIIYNHLNEPAAIYHFRDRAETVEGRMPLMDAVPALAKELEAFRLENQIFCFHSLRAMKAFDFEQGQKVTAAIRYVRLPFLYQGSQDGRYQHNYFETPDRVERLLKTAFTGIQQLSMSLDPDGSMTDPDYVLYDVDSLFTRQMLLKRGIHDHEVSCILIGSETLRAGSMHIFLQINSYVLCEDYIWELDETGFDGFSPGPGEVVFVGPNHEFSLSCSPTKTLPGKTYQFKRPEYPYYPSSEDPLIKLKVPSRAQMQRLIQIWRARDLLPSGETKLKLTSTGLFKSLEASDKPEEWFKLTGQTEEMLEAMFDDTA